MLDLEEELRVKRSKHFFMQWLVSGNRRVISEEAKIFAERYPKEARVWFDYFRKRSRKRVKGKKYLFPK